MTAPDEASLFEALSAIVASELGLVFRGSRTHGLVDGARRAARTTTQGDLAELVAGAQRMDPVVLAALAREITVGETYFFRDHAHFDVVRAATRAAIASGASLRLWSAGCSSGEEAYSLAIVALDTDEAIADRLEVFGTDLSTGALERARDAIYRPWSFRDVAPALVEKWFEPGEGTGTLRPIARVRKLARFARVNLVDGMGAPMHVDVVFCRNVLIYFDKPGIAGAGRVLSHCLSPGGLIVLGPSDPLLPGDDLDVDRTFGFFTWRRRTAAARSTARPPATTSIPPSRAPLTRPPPSRALAPVTLPPPELVRDLLGTAREHANRGAYERALRGLEGHAPSGASLALSAAILHAQGNLTAALQLAEAATLLDATSAEAWTLLATTALESGDRARAREALNHAEGLAMRAPPVLGAHASFEDLTHAIRGIEAQLARHRPRRR